MHLLTEHLLVVLLTLAAAVAVIFVVQQRRSPQSAAAWILFIVLVPYLAIPIFLMLGFRKRGSRFPPIRFSRPDTEPIQGNETETLFRALGAPPGLTGNAIELLTSPDTAREALETMLEDARETLDILLYIVAPDRAGREFVRLLTARARQGVKVRLSLDRLGTLFRPRRELAEFQAAGGELRFFSPFLHAPDNGHMNLRNHRKLVIADSRRVWAGGRNVGLHYLGSTPQAWTDLSYILTGPIVRNFMDVFASDWDLTSRVSTPPRAWCDAGAGPAALQLVAAGPDDPGDVLHDGLVSLIYNARTRVWLATPYFVPTESLQEALHTAARRGLDVRIFVPERSNQRAADLARGAYLRELAAAGAGVFRFQAGMLHAKAGLVDDVGWTGSANFDVRSLLLNFELVLLAYDPETVGGLEAWFSGIVEACETGAENARFARRVLEGVFRLGAPAL